MEQSVANGSRRKESEGSCMDGAAAAKAAGLHYVSDDIPGYTRRQRRRRFEYFDVHGKRIRDQPHLRRIKRLAIPPAWRDVWICPSSSGHIQATARDARGRKQYCYHHRWRELRDENKFDRLVEFGKALPNIRRRVARDIKLPGLPRPKVLATIMELLERTFIRIGNEEYARENKSFGLTTLKNRHVTIKGGQIRFRFRGKSGRHVEVDVNDSRVAKIILKCQDLPGQDLFQYIDNDGEIQEITSQDVNNYLREISGGDFTAKDFRTWGGTVLAATALSTQGKFETTRQAKANIKTAICAVAQLLHNTPAICRKCYVHPAVAEAYLNQTQIGVLKASTNDCKHIDLRAAERAVLKLLHLCANGTRRRRRTEARRQ